MSRVAKVPRVDPIAAAQKFKDDLAAMHVGPKDGSRPNKRMHSKNFGLAEFKRRRWHGVLDEQQSLEDALDPKFWVDQSAQIMGYDKISPKGRGDIIEVYKPDTGLYAELLIDEIGTGYVKTKIIAQAEPESVESLEDSPLLTRWNVGRRMHEVLRRSDGQVMAGGFQNKAAALDWIGNHLRDMAA